MVATLDAMLSGARELVSGRTRNGGRSAGASPGGRSSRSPTRPRPGGGTVIARVDAGRDGMGAHNQADAAGGEADDEAGESAVDGEGEGEGESEADAVIGDDGAGVVAGGAGRARSGSPAGGRRPPAADGAGGDADSLTPPRPPRGGVVGAAEEAEACGVHDAEETGHWVAGLRKEGVLAARRFLDVGRGGLGGGDPRAAATTAAFKRWRSRVVAHVERGSRAAGVGGRLPARSVLEQEATALARVFVRREPESARIREDAALRERAALYPPPPGAAPGAAPAVAPPEERLTEKEKDLRTLEELWACISAQANGHAPPSSTVPAGGDVLVAHTMLHMTPPRLAKSSDLALGDHKHDRGVGSARHKQSKSFAHSTGGTADGEMAILEEMMEVFAYAGATPAGPYYKLTELDERSGVLPSAGADGGGDDSGDESHVPLIACRALVRELVSEARAATRSARLDGSEAKKYRKLLLAETGDEMMRNRLTLTSAFKEALSRRFESIISGRSHGRPRGGRHDDSDSDSVSDSDSDSSSDAGTKRRRGKDGGAQKKKKKAKTGGGGGGGGGGGSGRDLCRRWAAHEVDSKNRKCPDGSKCKYRHAFRKGERKETERREKKRH